MTQPTAYQYVKLGLNLEFLRGIATASVMQTTSLAAFPRLMENLSARRYSVMQVGSELFTVRINVFSRPAARPDSQIQFQSPTQAVHPRLLTVR